MRRFFALITKELRILGKDLHGLLALFAMPAVFILIMSMAMQDTLGGETRKIRVKLVAEGKTGAAEALYGDIETLGGFSFERAMLAEASVREELAADEYQFALIVPAVWGNPESAASLKILAAPSVGPQLRELFRIAVTASANRALSGEAISTVTGYPGISLPNPAVTLEYAHHGDRPATVPTAVQQSVPAWLVFSMFFVVIPISTAYIIERQQGTLRRLQTFNISPWMSLSAKVAPYYAVNQAQMALMVLVGMFVVPLLGGDRLEMPSTFAGMLLISSATSIAAIGFALMLSVFARTTVQATTLGGVSNIIFGALGGVMVPKFIMPPAMQEVTVVSPMSWGMEGFLDVFLRRGRWDDVLPEAGGLLLFGAVCLLVAAGGFSRQKG